MWAVADKDAPTEGETPPHESLLHKLEEKVQEHLRAAEVAMEEAAGYGEVTATIKGAEAAVDPDSELGDGEDDEPSR
jgi:hypothetical protein